MLHKSVTYLPGIGQAQADKLTRLGIHTLENLLFHLPYNYQDRTQFIPIGSLRAGNAALIKGRVEHAEQVYRKRRSLLVKISDGTGTIILRFFYFNKSQINAFKSGTWLSVFGDVRAGFSTLEMVHPEYKTTNQEPHINEATLTPIYALTDGITQRFLRKHIDFIIHRHLENIEDYLDQLNLKLASSLLRRSLSYNLKSALITLHHPQKNDDIEALLEKTHPAQKRLALEELLAHQLSLQITKQQRQAIRAPALISENKLIDSFIVSLSFTLTNAQQRVINEIFEDLHKPQSMVRLVQGDVGSGKTVVAACAALKAIAAGYQVALMAPTELLAEQHYQGFQQWFEPLNLQVAYLNGRQKVGEKRQQLELIISGKADLVIGTHALFQESIEFPKLALVIVDEQHRFGVNQRLALVDKSNHAKDDNENSRDLFKPHQLIMTATPIPRSLAMIFYADMDVSNIDELPPGRTPIQTIAIGLEKREQVMQRVYHACQQRKQVYWVCPLIEESDLISAQAATDTFQSFLSQFKDMRVGLVHGRMKSQEKDAVMDQFRQHDIDLLVSTTVIEVGVDVPNASLMIIENAERLGLAQLHQLRGRVGRGDVESICVLLYQSPLSENARKRIAIMRDTTSGFDIALKDLEIRGPGELLGTKQSGIQSLKVADLIRDKDLLQDVILIGNHINNFDMTRNDSENSISHKIIQRWLPDSVRYGNV